MRQPTLLLGPGDLCDSSTEDVRKFLERKIPFCPGGGIAFVDARDAASGMILAMDRGRAARRYLLNAANAIVAWCGRAEAIESSSLLLSSDMRNSRRRGVGRHLS